MVGHYDLEGYSRGRILYKGLKKNKVEVDIFLGKGKLKYLRILKRVLKKDYDAIIATGTTTLFVVKFIKEFSIIKKPLILDSFISDYDTLVHDRKIVSENSLKARILWFTDKYSCKFADNAIVDTKQHKEYFVEEFDLDPKKFEIVPIGADDEIFYPRNFEENKKNGEEFNVTFFGSFIPLQGMQYILKSAKILENYNIIFNLIGEGQTFPEMKKLARKLELRNVNFLGWKRIYELPNFIANSDVCLGIFGNTEKAKRVIPNKVYEVIAMKKPIVTGDTPAIREFFRNRENSLLCEIANPDAIADAILELKDNPELREKIAKNGYKLFRENFSIEGIGKTLKIILNRILDEEINICSI